MRLHRIYVDIALTAGACIYLPPPMVKHLIQILRLRTGDRLILFNGDGRDYPAEITSATRHHIEARLDDPGELELELPLRVHLGICISKGDRMDFAVQKAVELGVGEVTPLFSTRSVVRLDGERLAKRQEHWRGILISACEQSGRRRLPRLNGALTLAEWICQQHPCAILLDPYAPRSLPGLAPPGPTLTLLIGPEGGLTQAERKLAYDAGFTGIRLGPRILRSETAPLAALAIAQALWGDIGI